MECVFINGLDYNTQKFGYYTRHVVNQVLWQLLSTNLFPSMEHDLVAYCTFLAWHGARPLLYQGHHICQSIAEVMLLILESMYGAQEIWIACKAAAFFFQNAVESPSWWSIGLESTSWRPRTSYDFSFLFFSFFI